MSVMIIEACESDLEGIVEIINSHINKGFNGVLESQNVSVGDKKHWYEQFSTSGKYRLFVAKKEKRILGYACSFKYRENKAFDRTIETSIYTHAKNKEKGIGSALYQKLFESIEDVHSIVVGIALPNEGSIKIHKKFGFEEIGVFKDYIYHNDRYTSSLWMQKIMGQE